MQFYFICIIDFSEVGNFIPGLGYFNNLLTVCQSSMVYMRVYFFIFQTKDDDTTTSVELWHFSVSSDMWWRGTPIWEQLWYLVWMEELIKLKIWSHSSSCVISSTYWHYRCWPDWLRDSLSNDCNFFSAITSLMAVGLAAWTRVQIRDGVLIWRFLHVKQIFASRGVGTTSSDQLITIVMRIFKEKTFFFGGWAHSYRLWAAILTVSEGMFCSAAGIWDTPLLIIMKWGKRQKLTFGSSLFLTELIIFSEGVWGFKKQQQQQRERRGVGRWNIQRGWRSVMWWALYCGDPFLNYSSRTVISPLFPGYKTPSIWHLWQRALFCSSTGRHQGWAWPSEMCWHLAFWSS